MVIGRKAKEGGQMTQVPLFLSPNFENIIVISSIVVKTETI